MQPIEEGSVQTSFLGRTLERNLGRQLGCLLVQRTQGETQQLATQWLSATNGWEAWRQLNLSHLSRFLNSLLRASQDDQPASFWQHHLAGKERVVGLSELSKEESQTKRDQSCKQKGELSRVNFPQNSRQQNKQQQQKQELARRGKGKGTPQEQVEAYKPLPQQQRGEGEQLLPNKAQRKGTDEKSNARAGACTDKLHKKGGKGKPTTPSFKKELTNKKGTLWSHFCRKKGHNAQACWWNGNQQAHKPTQTAWRRTNKKKELEQSQGNQSFSAWLASHKKLMNSFEKDTCMRRKDPMSMLVCSDQASSKTDWGTQVDNSAQKSFACDQKLSLALSTTTLAATELELHDHSLSSASSSSMSLDEDHTSFQHVLSCVCHVRDHVSDVVCMLCDEGLAVQGGRAFHP